MFEPITLCYEDFLFVVALDDFVADMDGDALHSSMGLPPALHVTTARVGKLEIVVGDS